MKEKEVFSSENVIPNVATEGKKSANVPNLRFRFDGIWRYNLLGEIADVTKLAGFEFTKYVVYEDTGKIIALRGLNCKNGILDLSDVKYIDKSDFSKINRSKLKIGDVLFTYVGTVDETAIIEENDRFYLAPNVSRMRVLSNINPYFLKHCISSEKFYKRIIFPLIATSSQPALSMENIRLFQIHYPTEIEQNKIVDFLQLIDERIHTQSKIIEELKTQKKWISQHYFMQRNSSSYGWEKTQLSAILRERKSFATKESEFPHVTLSKDGIYEKSDI